MPQSQMKSAKSQNQQPQQQEKQQQPSQEQHRADEATTSSSVAAAAVDLSSPAPMASTTPRAAVAKRKKSNGLKETKAATKKRYQETQNLKKRLNRLMEKAHAIFRTTRGVKRFMLYFLFEEVEQLMHRHRDVFAGIATELDLYQVSYWFCHQLVINGTTLDFEHGALPGSGDSLLRHVPALFTFLQDKHVDPTVLRVSPCLVVQKQYQKWMEDPTDRINFAGIIASFLALFLSFTDEFDDEMFYRFEQDAEEDDCIESLAMREVEERYQLNDENNA
ncbi:hypothetical protein V8B55DRAFT_1572672 [Mucor lusitanicus]|uniref:Uncharacterized protein n=2 Tax=Mucor circinelloides f. lusitanicus TaxID=29924 RepID=A0A168I4T6_MUCCL|nr:hypothetical protein FB192DRAFT_1458531 [Mucor lusitanicus]OAC99550.1 hypothetical protein MUCCIDRAFT_166970 [Mucor lusitanicus CBS 277.49]